MSHPLISRLAPDFTLPNQDGTSVTLSDFKGTPVLLVFTPFAFSPLYDEEVRAIRDSAALKKTNARVFVISCDSVFVLKAWADANQYSGDLLSDCWPHGEVSRWYGIFNPRRGIAIGASFLVGGDGEVKWAVVHAPDDPRSIDDYVDAIARL